MLYLILETLFMFLVAFGLGLFLSWLIWGRRTSR
jgi:hypothetical protein